jgi:hypothetical protein
VGELMLDGRRCFAVSSIGVVPTGVGLVTRNVSVVLVFAQLMKFSGRPMGRTLLRRFSH